VEDIEGSVFDMETALDTENEKEIALNARKLAKLADRIGSDALKQLVQSIVNDCENGMVDNVSIRWPATKNGLQLTMRVAYSHLGA
jgi:hypothetical protein